MKRLKYILLFSIFLYAHINVYAQNTCSDITITATSTVSDCRSNGTITIKASGLDIANLAIDSSMYRIMQVGGGYSTQLARNGGVFYGVPPGNFQIEMRAFCKLSDSWDVYTGTSSVEVKGSYIEPNMYIMTANVRKTLNCKVTGMIPIAFYDGKAPYKAVIVAKPSEYTGETEFTKATSGRLNIEDLPAGTYTFDLSDACGTTLSGLTFDLGTVASDFPSSLSIANSGVYLHTVGNCKTLTFSKIAFTAVSSTHELYEYLYNPTLYYDLVLTEGSNPTESIGTITGRTTSSNPVSVTQLAGTASLMDLDFKDLYNNREGSSPTLPQGTGSAGLQLRVKGTDCKSPKFPFGINRPYCSSPSITNITCTTFDYSVSIYGDYDGVVCFPVIATLYNSTTGAVVTSVTSSSRTVSFKDVPHGSYYVKFVGADGGEFYTGSSGKSIFTVNKPGYTASRNQYSYCREDGLTGNISVSVSGTSYFIKGTVIEVIDAPVGQVLPAPYTVPNVSTSIVYIYSTIAGSSGNYSKILPGTHKIRITNPCGDPPVEISVVFPEQSVTYNRTTSNSDGYCKANLGKNYGYLYSQDSFIPGGTVIECVSVSGGGDMGAVINGASGSPFTVPGGASKYFNPFNMDWTFTGYQDRIPPGTYTFSIWDGACQQYATNISIVVPEVYSIENFDHSLQYNTCSSVDVYPTGQIKLGTSNVTTYFQIYSAKDLNGNTIPSSDYDNRQIQAGNFLSLYRNGRYVIRAYNSSCFVDTFSVVYEQPVPRLDLSLTASYVCSGETSGYIQLRAVGGYGTGPYLYEIEGTSLSNQTGVFTYGEPNEILTIKITDKSQRAQDLGCSPSFTQQLTMLDLSEASIAYSVADGHLCAGETIYLNCISLGQTDYYWTGPNNFGKPTPVEGQFLTIPNAQPNHSGWYYVSVTPQSCGETKIDSMYITVHPIPVEPTVQNDTIRVCFNTGTYNIVNLSGAATVGTGNSLQWYSADGVTKIAAPTSVYSNNYSRATTYYLTQVSVAGCESAPVPIVYEIMQPPVSPVVPYHPPVCYGDSVQLWIDDSDIDLEYRMYTTSSGGIPLDVKQGTGGTINFAKVQFTATTSITYYISAYSPSTGCESSPRTGRQVTLATSSTAANIDIKTPDTTCINTSITLTATAIGLIDDTDAEFIWYNGSSANSAVLGTGTSYTTPVLTSSTTYYYYVAVKSANSDMCENVPNQRKQVTVRVLPALNGNSYVSSTNQTVCEGNSVTINVSSTVTNPMFYWYDSQTSTTLLHTGDQLILPAIYRDTIFYVGVDNEAYCESAPGTRKEIRITVNPYGVPLATDVSTCVGEDVSITALHSGVITNPVYRWYDSNTTGANLLYTGNPLVISNIQTNVSYYLSVSGNSHCETLPADRLLITVNVSPNASANNIIINDTSICYNTSTTLTASYTGSLTNPVYRWYTSQTAATPFHLGDTYATPTLVDDVTYYISVSATGVCENKVRKPVTINMIHYLSEYRDMRLQICPNPARTISLNSYVDTLLFKSIAWTGFTPIGSSTGEINTSDLSPGVYIYRYNISNTCTSSQAKVYLKVIGGFIKHTDLVVFCQEELLTKQINLKQIFGLEAEGTITAITPGANAYISEAPAGSSFPGSYYFDGTAAWGDSSFPSITYNGDTNAKQFEFRYTPSGTSCVDSPVIVTIIITSNLVP